MEYFEGTVVDLEISDHQDSYTAYKIVCCYVHLSDILVRPTVSAYKESSLLISAYFGKQEYVQESYASPCWCFVHL